MTQMDELLPAIGHEVNDIEEGMQWWFADYP